MTNCNDKLALIGSFEWCWRWCWRASLPPLLGAESTVMLQADLLFRKIKARWGMGSLKTYPHQLHLPPTTTTTHTAFAANNPFLTGCLLVKHNRRMTKITAISEQAVPYYPWRCQHQNETYLLVLHRKECRNICKSSYKDMLLELKAGCLRTIFLVTQGILPSGS